MPSDNADVPAVGNEVIVPGPELTKEYNEKRLKKVIKEGGKKGIEIEGVADMGGLQYFCTNTDTPEGDLTLLIEVMKAMNAPSDPSEEERKGGAGKIGKTILSFKDDKTTQTLSAVAYVPKHKEGECNATEWLQATIDMAAGPGVVTVQKVGDCDTKNWAAFECKTDSEKGIFPIKYRDPLISNALNYLRKKGLFPEDNDDDDDEMVFGDDDFP